MNKTKQKNKVVTFFSEFSPRLREAEEEVRAPLHVHVCVSRGHLCEEDFAPRGLAREGSSHRRGDSISSTSSISFLIVYLTLSMIFPNYFRQICRRSTYFYSLKAHFYSFFYFHFSLS